MDAQPAGDATPTPATAKRSGSRSPRRGSTRMRTVHETSAGGLVIDGIDGPRDAQVAALIGRVDRRGRLLWSLPKGHIELGETAEQTAIREVAEETGIRGSVLAALGRIDYWFVTDGRRVHKTVHHYLMRFLGGELSDEDLEVAEVAWVPIRELPSRLAYADERRLAEVADELIDKLQSDGPPRFRRYHPARLVDGRKRIHALVMPMTQHRVSTTVPGRGRDRTATRLGRFGARHLSDRRRGRPRDGAHGTVGGTARARRRAQPDAFCPGPHRSGDPGRGDHFQRTPCHRQRNGDQYR